MQYEDDATEVDADPSDSCDIKKSKAGDKPASVLVDFNDGEDTVEDSQIGTETFHKPGVSAHRRLELRRAGDRGLRRARAAARGAALGADADRRQEGGGGGFAPTSRRKIRR